MYLLCAVIYNVFKQINVRNSCAFVINTLSDMQWLQRLWFCITVALCSNGPVGPNNIPLTHISHHRIPCQRADVQLTNDAVSDRLNVMCAAAKHTVLYWANLSCMWHLFPLSLCFL